MRKDFTSGSRGFTLIELMIVIVIMGFILAFAGPRIAKSLGGLSLKTTAKKVAATLRYARSQAVNTGQIYNVIFDSEKNRVIVLRSQQSLVSDMTSNDNATDEEESGDEDSAEAALPKMPRQEIKVCPLPDGITFSKISIADAEFEGEEGDEIYQMAFFPNGTSHGAEIILTDSRERMFRIDVNFITGAVSVAEQTDE